MAINVEVAILRIALIMCWAIPALKEVCLWTTVKQMSVSMHPGGNSIWEGATSEVETTEVNAVGPFPEERNVVKWKRIGRQ